MKCKLAVVLGVAVLLAASRPADARVFFRNLVGDDVGYKSWWPEGLKEVVLSHPRAGGQETDAPTWGNGMVSVELYFAGNQAAFNEFLLHYSKVKAEKLVLIIHPGKGVYRARTKKGDKPPPFDWRVAVSVNGVLPREGVEQTTHFNINYYLSERGYTMGLEVPDNVVVVPSYNSKQRDANPDDPTMNAIDTFIEVHQRRSKSDD